MFERKSTAEESCPNLHNASCFIHPDRGRGEHIPHEHFVGDEHTYRKEHPGSELAGSFRKLIDKSNYEDILAALYSGREIRAALTCLLVRDL